MNDFNFSWQQLGDIQEGRPNLGNMTSVAAYRLMQYTMRAVLVHELGDEKTKQLLTESGRLAGKAFCQNVLDTSLPMNKFIAQLHEKLIEHTIGILRVEKADPEKFSFVVTVSEDLDCSGLPLQGVTVCDYDEGFIEGIFHLYTQQNFIVKEIDCWTTGERTCRFTIDLNNQEMTAS